MTRKAEDTSTQWTTSETGGNFGYLSPPTPLVPDVEELLDLETLGMNFTSPVASEPLPAEPDEEEPVTGIKQAETLPLTPVNAEVNQEDVRTNEDIRAAHMQLIVNAIDLPQDVIDEAKQKLIMCTGEFRDFVMTEVIPVVLAVNPAMVSARQMVPALFDNGEDLDIDLPMEQLATFAQGTGILAARLKLMDMLKLPSEVKRRLLDRLIPVGLPEKRP